MWVKSKIYKKGGHGWNDYYSKVPGMTFLSEEGECVWIGFCMPASKIDDRHIEIVDYNDLMKIQKHREAANISPLPMEIIKR